MSKNFTAIKYCKWCGEPFEVKSPNQKYCSPDIKNCSKEAKRESWRKAAHKYRENYKDVLKISQVYKLGSGFLSSNPKEEFNAEYKAIQKEKKRLKLNSIGIGFWFWVQYNLPFMRNLLERGNDPLELYPALIIIGILLLSTVIFGVYYK
ncbi:MAG: hypothetical protein K8E24_008275 [Methanobacterium paludis]|nr:hypothetical protein [Methanobacterium paludis]